MKEREVGGPMASESLRKLIGKDYGEVDADDYEAVCLFESDVEAFSNQYGREPKEPLEWLAWRKDRRREERELLLDAICKQV